MLYYLFHYLDSLGVPGAGVFDYISFRAAMAIITSLLISMVFGKKIIALLKKQQIGETVRDLGLEGQKAKEGTPTMGGLIILASVLIPTLLFAKLENIYVIIMIIATILLGLIGFIDDYIKVFKKNKEGLAGRFKIVGQIIVGIIVGSILYFSPSVQVHENIPVSENMPNSVDVTEKHQEAAPGTKWVMTKDMTTTIPFVKDNEFNYNWLIGDTAKSYGWMLFIRL
jgi:phospho-N-acetylmuramoyl-pentapeptide-transferase